MNAENYEEVIRTDFDIVIATSILKWINDQDRFMKYLSNFSQVIYEGHDDDATEIARFVERGFPYHVILGATQTGVSYANDNKRTLILFKKVK